MTDTLLSPSPPKYDAFLLVSFGGPEGMDDVLPFLENVLRGRNVPHERMVAVAHHYRQFDGISPINAQNRALIAALEAEFAAANLDLPIYFGNRNWHPLLADTLRQMADDGVRHALAFFTSIYSSYSGCRQYRENLYAAQEAVGRHAPQIDRLRFAYNHPRFIQANVARVRAAMEKIPPARRGALHIAFTAHSLPLAQAKLCRYQEQLLETSRLVAEAVGVPKWQLVYQSRSGPPAMPWLEPDICDHLSTQKAAGVKDLLIAPIGFISDHMEVVYDLDTEARERADAIGLNVVRAATVGTHPAFVRMIRDLVIERSTAGAERIAVGRFPAGHDVCAADCCLSGRPTPPLPAAAQSEESVEGTVESLVLQK